MQHLIKLAVVDDSLFYRQALIKSLEKNKDLKIIIEALNGKDLINAIEHKKLEPDIILLDLEMPVMDGVKTTEYLSRHHPDIKILILTQHNDEGISQELIKKGANGFLFKKNGLEKIVDAIYSVAKYQYYFAGWNLQKIVTAKNNVRKRLYKNKVQFSKRELEIMELICQQYTNKEISDKLYISTRTVDGHRDKLLQKTNSYNSVGLAMYAMQNGLITKQLASK